MNSIKSILVAFLVVTSIGLSSCTDEKKATTTEEKTELTEKQGKEYDSDYVCPMHCEGSGSTAEGSCPTCGMAYVKKEDHKANGHKHE